MLASDFLKKLKVVNESGLHNIKGIGEVLSNNFVAFLESPRYQKLVADFEKLEAENIKLDIFSKSRVTGTGLPLSAETICITGTFEISRNEIKAQLESLGASVTDTVSQKTTILLAGESAGSKLEKAQKLNLKIVTDLDELLKPA